MREPMKYICNYCGQEHEDWPALTYPAPTAYLELSETDRQNLAELNSDFCIITHPEQTDRFIRCTLTMKVLNHCKDLDYGLWVSLSENSFKDYSDHFADENHVTNYFGWLNNVLPDNDLRSIPTTVFTRPRNQRPEIVPHKDFEHPFVKDYYDGITKAEAERRISEMLQIVERRDK